MGNIPDQTVICKCLNLIELSDNQFPIFNYRRKFTLVRAVKLLIDAQLNQRTDLEDICNALRANEDLQQALNLESISSSQLVRTLRALPLPVLQQVWLEVTQRLQQVYPKQGIPGIGKLSIVDSTILTLPDVAGKWAYCSKHSNGVKIHIKLVVCDPDTVYPENIVCSTQGVGDKEVALDLVIDKDAIHVLDRGYITYRHYKQWLDQNLHFVARIQKSSKTKVICEREVDETTPVSRDADVIVSYKDEGHVIEAQLRLVEYTDEKNRQYRVLTNVWDKSAAQICEIYRRRWMIELFFKWMKQHLSLVHLYSSHPEAVWNQIFLAMIAYGLVMLVHKEADTTQTLWSFLKLLRLYMNKTWDQFLMELHRKPTKYSKGRRKKRKGGRPRKHPKQAKSVKVVVK
ncbi:IS4 family transposase [Paenibacillus thiaminolyticus]|uniref:IS4 family transposase n=1 Tax=Paenibacillus thiaminolyticus TaxID=49283 RepID=UPI00232FFB7E|nr:IS4 family transposase [Paenibacillus thiaminolyticus]WCF06603.1 IS4 family transposase [Paenibacillus thiaminolyticus]WCF07971.1 IS4 family transposase [Paenibacillus thiaminolyticus]